MSTNISPHFFSTKSRYKLHQNYRLAIAPPLGTICSNPWSKKLQPLEQTLTPT